MSLSSICNKPPVKALKQSGREVFSIWFAPGIREKAFFPSF